MPLAANALVTMQEARDYLGTGASEDPRLERAVNRASELIEGYCDRPLRRTTAHQPATLRLSWVSGTTVRVGAEPIDTAQAVTVTFDGVAQTVWRAAGDGDPDTFDVVVGYVADGVFHPGRPERALFRPNVLYRTSWRAAKVGGVVITYHGALATIPDDLKDAALLLIRRLFDHQQKGLVDVVTVNTPSGGVTLFDRWMPVETREVLDARYRRWSL